MAKRYNGWRELRTQSGYDRRKVVRNQRICFGIGVAVVLILLIIGGVFLWKHLKRGDDEAAGNPDAVTATPVPSAVPTATPTEVPTKEPVQVLVEEYSGLVVLDAGHGGIDGGTFCEDVLEKDINFAVVQYIKEILESSGVEVSLTRSGDDFLDVSERTSIANSVEGADLFVSIHCNYFEDDESVSGLEIYYYTGDEEGQACAEQMIDLMKENKDIKVRSAKHGGYYVLKFTDIPAVLVEMGFLSNPAERDKLNSAEYQKLLAEELAEGILANLKKSPGQNPEQSPEPVNE